MADTHQSRAQDEATLLAASKSDPENAELKHVLATTLARNGKFKDALIYFRQAASLAPDNPAALMGVAQTLNSIDEHNVEALAVYAKVAHRFPDTVFGKVAKQILARAEKALLKHEISPANESAKPQTTNE